MPDRSQSTILVVDDSEAGRYAVARGLRSEGFATLEAASGREALDRAADVAAIVLDVHLPDILGLDVCRTLRERPATARLPIVHVSAVYVTGHAQAAAERAGADAYLLAPVNTRELAQTLDRLIARGAAS